MGKNDFILDAMTWSYSRVSAYKTCPRMFKMQYIDDERGVNNAFAEYGTFIHSILEKYYKGKLSIFELANYYKEHYGDNVTAEFPRFGRTDLAESYYNSGLDYLTEYEDPFSDDEEVIAVEKKINMELNGYRFTGIIDLLLKNKQTGEITIVDHKSHNFKSKKEIEEYAKQLYLYALATATIFGHYPMKLTFNTFRNGQVISLDFESEKAEEVQKWFTDTIAEIYADEKFEPKKDATFCNTICSVRRNCPCSSEYGLVDDPEDENAD